MQPEATSRLSVNAGQVSTFPQNFGTTTCNSLMCKRMFFTGSYTYKHTAQRSVSQRQAAAVRGRSFMAAIYATCSELDPVDGRHRQFVSESFHQLDVRFNEFFIFVQIPFTLFNRLRLPPPVVQFHTTTDVIFLIHFTSMPSHLSTLCLRLISASMENHQTTPYHRLLSGLPTTDFQFIMVRRLIKV